MFAPFFIATLGMTVLSWTRAAATGAIDAGSEWMTSPWDVVASLVLLALLFATWVGHRNLATAMGDRAADPRSIRRLAWIGVALAACALPMTPLLSNDIFSALAYSDLALQPGANPYTLRGTGLQTSTFLAEVSSTWKAAPCVYGPVQLALLAPAVALSGGSLLVALLLAKILGFLAVAGIIIVLAWHVSRADREPIAASWFALIALSPILFLEGAGQASTESIGSLLLALWLVLASRGRTLPAAVAMGLAVASKLTIALPATMWVLYLLARPALPLGRRLAGVIAVGSIMLAAAALAFLPMWDGLDTILKPLAFLPTREPTNSLFEPLYIGAKLMGADRARVIAGLGPVSAALLFAFALLATWVSVRARDFRDFVAGAAMVLLLVLTVAQPVFHPWYLLPGLVLAIEIRVAVWMRWLLPATTLVIAVDGTGLLPLGSGWRIAYTVATSGLACVVFLLGIRGRLRSLFVSPK